jgi:hypothetical protein
MMNGTNGTVPNLLTKAAILTAADLRTQIVDVPEWGGAVTVRTMTGVDRDAFENSMLKVDAKGNRSADLTNMRAKLCALTLVDDAGNPLFTIAEVEQLAQKNAAALDRIFKVAQALNGLTADSVEAAEKNSGPGPSAASTSV